MSSQHILLKPENTQSEILLKNNFESNYVKIKSSDTATSSYTLNFPDGVGSVGQFLKTDGNNPATLSWSDVNDSNIVSTTEIASTTSESYVDLDSMGVTPGAGTYLVIFSASGKLSLGNSLANYIIKNNGTNVLHSERNLSGDGIKTLYTQSIETVSDSEEINVQFKTDGGTFTIYERNLILIEINN